MKHQKSLMRAVGKARRAWQQHVREVAQGMGIPDSYREVIMYLYHNPGAGQKQIAAFAQITASAVNQAVKSMEAEGYLRKETDPADKRMRNALLIAGGVLTLVGVILLLVLIF